MPVTNQKLDWIRQMSGLEPLAKKAFVDSGSMGGAPPMDPAAMDPAAMAPPVGGAPMGQPIPMDPAMMGGGAPPMDPAAMGGAPPMDPAMMGGAPPMDPSAMAMGGQEAIRSIIREEIQKAMGGGVEGGMAPGGVAKKGGNKFDEAISTLKEEMQQQMKVFVTAMRKAGIEIPLADLFSLDGSLTPDAPLGQPSPGQPSQPGASETLSPGSSGLGDNAAAGVGKIAAFEQATDALLKLAKAKDALNRSALGRKMTPFNPNQVDMDYFNGLYT
jgi:hypothetical protein